MLTRRFFLAALPAAAALAAPAIVRAQAAGPFRQPPLPFDDTALQPVIGQQTVQLHYGRHHAGYYTALNRLTDKRRYADMPLEQVVTQSALVADDRAIFNQAGQALNHELYWAQFVPGGAKAPSGKLLERIDRDLGGMEKMKTDLIAAAGGVFGSGWAWLAEQRDGKLVLAGTAGGDTPLTQLRTPLLGIDVWEHAYYLDFQNRRTDHVKAVLDEIVNWDVVSGRMKT